MPLIYLDQNALIELGRKARHPKFRRRLDSALKSGFLTVVVSSWHLIETASSPKLQPAEELAKFIDSLNPAWLLERHDILKIEVAVDFFRFASIEYHPPALVTTRSAMLAALNRQPDNAKFDIPTGRFVRQWWQHKEQLRPLEKPYKDNCEALTRLRELKKQGKITADIRKRTDQQLLKVSMPKSTPAGLALGRDLSKTYIEQADVALIPTLAIETAISEHQWDAQGGVDKNTLIDKVHLIAALPYVDEIVSKDNFFHRIYPVAQRTGHVRAELVGNDEFLKRFSSPLRRWAFWVVIGLAGVMTLKWFPRLVKRFSERRARQ